MGVLVVVFLGLCAYSRHCKWVTSEAYSSPSIVLISGWGPYRCGRGGGGSVPWPLLQWVRRVAHGPAAAANAPA